MAWERLERLGRKGPGQSSNAVTVPKVHAPGVPLWAGAGAPGASRGRLARTVHGQPGGAAAASVNREAAVGFGLVQNSSTLVPERADKPVGTQRCSSSHSGDLGFVQRGGSEGQGAQPAAHRVVSSAGRRRQGLPPVCAQ